MLFLNNNKKVPIGGGRGDLNEWFLLYNVWSPVDCAIP